LQRRKQMEIIDEAQKRWYTHNDKCELMLFICYTQAEKAMSKEREVAW
jgi:hypothetical protein